MSKKKDDKREDETLVILNQFLVSSSIPSYYSIFYLKYSEKRCKVIFF